MAKGAATRGSLEHSVNKTAQKSSEVSLSTPANQRPDSFCSLVA